MRKRLISFLLMLLMLCSAGSPALAAAATPRADTPAAYAASDGKPARVSQMEILLDGQTVHPSGYLITVDGNSAYTYFKLRDIAYLMRDKECRFDVTYDAAAGVIRTTRGEAYVGDGTELQPVGSGNQTATPASATILVDGEPVSMDAYTIADYTYFKLRDIGEVFGFEVDYRNESRQGVMKTPGYVEPEPTPEPEPDPTPTPDPAPDPAPEPEPEPEKSPVDGQLTVLIDVGHGGSDGGSQGVAPKAYTNYKGETVAQGAAIPEKDFNLPVALYLRDLLEASGAKVIMTAETDTYVSFAKRKEIIEENAGVADLCFSVHHNAFNGNAAGFEILAQVQYEEGGAGAELGAVLEKHYLANGRTRHRSTVFRHGQQGDYYAILRYAANVNMLAVISEYAFIDHSGDVLCVLSDQGLRDEAQAMHDAILDYFSTHAY